MKPKMDSLSGERLAELSKTISAATAELREHAWRYDDILSHIAACASHLKCLLDDRSLLDNEAWRSCAQGQIGHATQLVRNTRFGDGKRDE